MELQTPELGSQLRHHRVRAGLTQEELAERAGLSPRAISALERGERRRPYPHTMRALAQALGLSETERAEFLAVASHAPVLRPATATHRTEFICDLPSPPTPIIGREREEAAVASLLDRPDVRLLTLTGPGGVGKARLDLQVTAGVRDRFDSVCFVGLAPLTDSRLVPAAVAHALGVGEWGHRGTVESLRGALHDRRVLILLDNFEHLAAAGPFVAELLVRFPRLRLLVTSRGPCTSGASMSSPFRRWRFLSRVRPHRRPIGPADGGGVGRARPAAHLTGRRRLEPRPPFCA